MDSGTHEPHGFLKRLSRQLKAFEFNHPSHDDLQRLGIQVSQVAAVDDEIMLFDPCFFRPHPDRLLQKYPINLNPEENEKPPRLRLVPTFEEILEDCQEEYSDPEEVQEAVESQIETLQNLQYHEDYIQPGIYRLWDLGDQEFFSYWQVKHTLRYSSGRGPLRPHTVMSCIAGVAVNDTDQGLTPHELEAIVNMILIRVNHRPFRNCHIHPLALSFLGPQKGRIVQAVYDGKALALQHSQPWTFEEPQTAPVEMFVRYHLNQPVGLEMSTLCVR
ncbi:hypothetical protein PITC_032040 [Penicillium italicum]|uniref:Uncharacterized protein n=1 Tax=Penicillium italicum TaxID=40296 RepID=A0A0A2L721_PENIT|nr:hypothetical protein PITC_032040 [Penicillium italicum]